MSPERIPRDGKRDGALSPQLTKRLDAASHGHLLSHQALQKAVCDYLDELREHGMPRDEAFVKVQLFVVAARASAHAERDVSEAQHDQITDWCSERWPD
jgi:hypothetical protein